MTRFLLGVCGGIASYKSAYLASLIVKNNFDVKAVMTEAACRFISPPTFRSITGNKVYLDLFDGNFIHDHTSLSEWADLIIIAPATANTLAKVTYGFADNLLTAVILDFTGPVFIFPAMHENMWKNAPTQKNVKELKGRGFFIFGPERGALAGGKEGMGRMISPEKILNKIINILKKKYPLLLKNK